MRRAFAVILVLLILWGVATITARSLNGINFSISSNVVLIPIYGAISMGNSGGVFGDEGANSNSIISYLDKAEEDAGVKGIILDINSGGGNVVASKEIATKVKNMKKPTVALIREVGASGAYWVASAADKIVADELSVTGSIGVRSGYLEFSELMRDYGVKYESLVGGKYKDAGSPYRELTDEERTILQNKVNLIHENFIKSVSENRGVNLKPLATGMFFLGEEAVANGMIDYLGSKDKALEIVKELAGVDKAKIITYKKKRTIKDVIGQFLSEVSFNIGAGIGESFKAEDEFVIEA